MNREQYTSTLGLSDQDGPPRWAKLIAGLLLGGATLAIALSVMRSAGQQQAQEPPVEPVR